MLKKLLGNSLLWIADRIDPTVSQLQRLDNVKSLDAFVPGTDLDDQVLEDLAFLREERHLATRCFTTGPLRVQLGAATFDQWRNSLPKCRVVSKGQIASASGHWLDYCINKDTDGFLRDNVERLMRHVEIRRSRAFDGFFEAGSRVDSKLVEACEISMMLSRLAIHFEDRRYLNTSLKITDLLHSRVRDVSDTNIKVRYARSIVEQEIVAREMVG